MGTPEFSVKSLESLIKSNYKILCVYSQPPKKKGRGQKSKISPVHKIAEKYNLTVRTPNNLNTDEEINYFKSTKPNVVIVVAYGKLIPEQILKIPNVLFINLHASLLPKWRGAAPIERSILNKDRETGVSIMKIISDLDAGPYLKQVKIKLNKNDTYGEIYKKLSEVGANALIESLKIIENGNIKFIDQDNEKSSYAKKIEKDETKINWFNNANDVIAKINAFSPYPGAWFSLNGKRIKILKAKEVDKKGNACEIIDNDFVVACSSNSIKVLELQKEGKRAMKTREFLIGNKLTKGIKLF